MPFPVDAPCDLFALHVEDGLAARDVHEEIQKTTRESTDVPSRPGCMNEVLAANLAMQKWRVDKKKRLPPRSFNL